MCSFCDLIAANQEQYVNCPPDKVSRPIAFSDLVELRISTRGDETYLHFMLNNRVEEIAINFCPFCGKKFGK